MGGKYGGQIGGRENMEVKYGREKRWGRSGVGIKCERDARLLSKGRENNLGEKVGWCHFWKYGRKKERGWVGRWGLGIEKKWEGKDVRDGM